MAAATRSFLPITAPGLFRSEQDRRGAASRLSYIEIVNANHFDGFISMFGKKRLVPMHYYLDQALSKMRSHLLDPVTHPLPESQVVRGAGREQAVEQRR